MQDHELELLWRLVHVV